jgi:regulator of sigma E protease
MGDTVVKVNGKSVNTWYDVGVECLLGTGKSNEVALAVESDGVMKEMVISTSENEMGVQSMAGVEKAPLCLVTNVLADSGADVAGVRPGDIIVELRGRRVAGSAHFVELIGLTDGNALDMTVRRKGQMVSLSVVPQLDEQDGLMKAGLYLVDAHQGGIPWMQYKKPYMQLKYDAVAIIRILKALVNPAESGPASKGLGGPVMIVATLWWAISVSLLNAVGFLRFLNLNLAILNLLPIPVLDGGHIVFSLWEALTRRKVNARLVNVLVNIFAVLLIGVLILLTFRDSPRVWKMVKMLRRAENVEETGTNGIPEEAGENGERGTGNAEVETMNEE